MYYRGWVSMKDNRGWRCMMKYRWWDRMLGNMGFRRGVMNYYNIWKFAWVETP